MVSRTNLEKIGSLDSWGDYTIEQKSEQPSPQNSSPVTACWLNQFSALKISGPDAERFLQGQLTCNLNEINTDTSHFGACCNAKGRIVANFTISFDGENYWLVLPTQSADLLEKHLQKYKVFFKATIENCKQSHLIFGLFSPQQEISTESQEDHNKAHQLLNISNQRQLLIIENDSDIGFDLLASLIPTLDWRLADISEGILYIEAEQSEQWIPQYINWHKLDGISFNKGCYTGQEIIARLQYLGKTKKSLQYYRLDSLCDIKLAIKAMDNQLLNQAGKIQGDILIYRPTSLTAAAGLSVLAVINSENPDETLYLTDSDDFPLTLQNLPYTEKKAV